MDADALHGALTRCGFSEDTVHTGVMEATAPDQVHQDNHTHTDTSRL